MERLTGYQATMLISVFVVELTLGPVSAQLLAVAGQDAWLAFLLALVAAIGLAWLLDRVQRRFPDQPLMDALVGRHPVGGRAVAWLYLPFVLLVMARDLRIIVDFVNVALLQRTPLLVIGLMLVGTLIFVARLGNRVLGRLAELFGPLQVAVVAAMVLTTGNLAQPRFLAPVFEFGPGPVLAGSLLVFPYLAEMVLVVLVCLEGPFRFRDGARGLAVGVAQLITLVVLNILVLGPHLGHRFLYPSYMTVRQIRITDFLDRWDLVIVADYYPALLTRLGADLYIFCRLLSYAVPGVAARQIATPAAALALVGSLWLFRDGIEVLAVNRVWWIAALPFELLIPLLLFLFLRPARGAKKPRSL